MKTFIAKKLFKDELNQVYKLGYVKGRGAGIVEERNKVLQRLEHHSVKPFNSDELTLGYKQAVEAVKDSLARH